MTGYPRSFERNALLVSIACAVSGWLLVPGSLELRWEAVIPWSLPPGWGLRTAMLHGVTGSLCTAFLGAIWLVHMRAGWRKRMHRVTGVGSAALLVGLVVSGWGIYYVGGGTGAWVSLIHIVVGLAVPVIVWIHVRAGKRA